MNAQQRMWALAALAAVLAVGTAGCGRRMPETFYYFINVPQPAGHLVHQPALNELPVLLAIREFAAAPGLDKESLAYRPADYRHGFYGYHQWVAPPVRLMNERIRSELSQSRGFKHVLSAGREAEADIVLDGSVTAFHEEDAADGWHGAAGLELILQDVRTRQIFWSQAYLKRVAAADQTPAAVVAAINKAVDQLFPRITTDIHQAIAGYLTAQTTSP